MDRFDGAVYPALQLPEEDSDLVIHRFVLPIRIMGVPLWGLLDTGAGISVLPNEVATEALDLRIVPGDDDLRYTVAGLVDVPYQSRSFTVDILEHIPDTIREFDIHPYDSDGSLLFSVPNVDFKIPTMTYPEMASRLHPEEPLDVEEAPNPLVILGMQGFLEELHLAFTGDNAVRISRR